MSKELVYYKCAFRAGAIAAEKAGWGLGLEDRGGGSPGGGGERCLPRGSSLCFVLTTTSGVRCSLSHPATDTKGPQALPAPLSELPAPPTPGFKEGCGAEVTAAPLSLLSEALMKRFERPKIMRTQDPGEG